MAVSPGRFRESVTIERPTRARNSFGESEITAWVLVAIVWAEVLAPTSPDRAHEVASAGRPAQERLLQFRLRAPLDLRDGDRLIWNGEHYGIEGTLPDPARGELLATGRFLSGTDGR